jgi:hypothetical protein
MNIPVIQESDGVFKTYYDPNRRAFVQPAEGAPTIGLSCRSFATKTALVSAYPRCNFTIKSTVPENTKIAEDTVTDEEVEKRAAEYEARNSPKTPKIDDALVDLLAERILKKLEEKLKLQSQ